MKMTPGVMEEQVFSSQTGRWLNVSEEPKLQSFMASRELSTTTGWPNSETEWMSPNLAKTNQLCFKVVRLIHC